jgi:hypothetical protein
MLRSQFLRYKPVPIKLAQAEAYATSLAFENYSHNPMIFSEN